MLHYIVAFLAVVSIAASLGFTGVAASAVGITKILFFLLLVVTATALAVGLARRT